MDSYKVIISPKALSQLTEAIDYIQYELFNESAAKSLWEDAMETTIFLESAANSFRLCSNPSLNRLGYHFTTLKHHDYILLYRIENLTVFVDGIYHERQDYENLFLEDIR